jgi:glutaminase
MKEKYGVCGGIMIVIKNVMGIFEWYKKIDKLGKRCRGMNFSHHILTLLKLKT